jgi:hypothetical protein
VPNKPRTTARARARNVGCSAGANKAQPRRNLNFFSVISSDFVSQHTVIRINTMPCASEGIVREDTKINIDIWSSQYQPENILAMKGEVTGKISTAELIVLPDRGGA